MVNYLPMCVYTDTTGQIVSNKVYILPHSVSQFTCFLMILQPKMIIFPVRWT